MAGTYVIWSDLTQMRCLDDSNPIKLGSPVYIALWKGVVVHQVRWIPLAPLDENGLRGAQHPVGLEIIRHLY